MTAIDIDARIPNNVGLADDRRLQRALESWQPRFIEWWKELGPVAFQDNDVYLRTADRRRPGGLGQLRPRQDARLPLGHLPGRARARPHGSPSATTSATPVWQEVPGEYRADLRRLLVVQGDTEPASVEQQRALCLSAPSLYDLRNLFQVNVEEGRHLWAMVYLLHRYFGRDGRDEADEMLERHSGDHDHPRILGAFNEPTPDWLSFFFFTYFTDRDGKFQLASLRESAFDPLVADVRLHAQGGGPPHVRGRHRHRPGRAAHRRADEGARHRRRPAVRRHRRRRRCSATSTSTAACRSTCSAPRRRPTRPTTSPPGSRAGSSEERATTTTGCTTPPATCRPSSTAPPAPGRRRRWPRSTRRCATTTSRTAAKGVERWNRTLAEVGAELRLPHVGFNRAVGVFRDHHVTPDGRLVDDGDVGGVGGRLAADRRRPGPRRVADARRHRARPDGRWLAPPANGIHAKPVDYEYVRV